MFVFSLLALLRGDESRRWEVKGQPEIGSSEPRDDFAKTLGRLCGDFVETLHFDPRLIHYIVSPDCCASRLK